MDNFSNSYDYISDDEISKLLGLYAISDQDLERIRSLGTIMLPRIKELVDTWYTWLETQAEYEQFFSEPETLERVKKLQHDYWSYFFSGEIDEAYLRQRKRVGETHARIGLPLTTYFASMNTWMEIYGDVLGERASSSDETSAEDGHIENSHSLAKLLHLDTAVVVETYSHMVNEQILSQTKSLMEMSTPVTQIWSGILLLPLVGIIDSKRAQDIMNATLGKISQLQARVFILDISGVAVVDTAVANHLIKITKATRLMGCESIISGVSPAIAQTVVELGIDVGTVKTTATMKDALSDAFRRTGMEISELN